MNRKQKHHLYRILAAGAVFGVLLPLHYTGAVSLPWQLAIALVAYAIIGYDIIWKALLNIKNGQIFDENFLMTVATVGAFLLGEYPEAVAVMLFYQVGELFQSCAVARSRRSIADLMDIRPDYANVMRDGALVQVDPEEVPIGGEIIVRPGERIPMDGVVLEGHAALDTSALTGESALRDVAAGDGVISGCINTSGRLTIEVTKSFDESTVSKILELVENATDKKSKSEAFITRFARYYTPFVVLAAVVLAVLPPLMTGQAFAIWVQRALTFLVISCPCALVISVPLSFFGGIGGASKSGVLVKGSNYLEALAKADIMVFDKTGTLTKGNFAVKEVRSQTMSREALLHLAAHAEDVSSHPIAGSIKAAYGKAIDPALLQEVEELPGHGVKAMVDGKAVLAGNTRLLDANQIPYEAADLAAGTAVYLAVDGAFAGFILIEDELKEDAPGAIRDLKAAGIKQTIMLTGDNDAVGQRVARALHLDQVYTQLLPGDKVSKVEELMEQGSGPLAYVGDGVNDAPVLARADIGIAMGGLGSDAAIEAADIVIMTDEPSKIVTARAISKKTMSIVRQNIVFALLVKAAVMVLGAMGLASMWAAVFADVGVSILAILNAIRALRVPPNGGQTSAIPNADGSDGFQNAA